MPQRFGQTLVGLENPRDAFRGGGRGARRQESDARTANLSQIVRLRLAKTRLCPFATDQQHETASHPRWKSPPHLVEHEAYIRDVGNDLPAIRNLAVRRVGWVSTHHHETAAVRSRAH